MTGPDGSVLARTILGDRLLVTAGEVAGEHDSKQILYFDLPVPARELGRRLCE